MDARKVAFGLVLIVSSAAVLHDGGAVTSRTPIVVAGLATLGMAGGVLLAEDPDGPREP